MNINKHKEFFNPYEDLKHPIHIIGCGAIGSTVAEMLTRMGVPELNIYDFDTVMAHNITNQIFIQSDIGKLKEQALEEILQDINSDITVHKNGPYKKQPLAGYIFLCVDDIDLRREICENNKYNPNIKAIFDFRMRLTDAQHYAADWSDTKQKENLIAGMQFTHEEAKEATPVSACGTSLNVVPTVRLIVSLGLGNFINFIKGKELKKMILADAFSFIVDAF